MPTIKVSTSGDGGTLYFPKVLNLQAFCISKMRLKTRETDAMRRASKTLFPTIVLAVAIIEQEEENLKLLLLFVVSRELKVMLKAINIL